MPQHERLVVSAYTGFCRPFGACCPFWRFRGFRFASPPAVFFRRFAAWWALLPPGEGPASSGPCMGSGQNTHKTPLIHGRDEARPSHREDEK